ncbi:transposase [Thermospira aquatica]|uniref:Mutator family transposase n=1 Tax=Thermospira aquatica TaxID=2828656 RepID=A0AAX3BH60_9SPIR|nr:transposase [Thermospira aquatica]
MKISYDNISRISQVGIEEIQKWRSRPLMEEYAVVFLDAMVFPIKRDRVENESIYVAIGITPEEDGDFRILPARRHGKCL